MPDLTTIDELHAALRATRSSRSIFVGVEGHSTSGKTTLAKDLADLTAGKWFGTDTYGRQRRSGENYPDLIDVERLGHDIALAFAYPLVVIEGICLRDVLDRAGLQPDAFVYVKRISPAGLWVDDLANHVISGEPNPELSWVDTQSVLYHLRRSPLEQADLTYLYLET